MFVDFAHGGNVFLFFQYLQDLFLLHQKKPINLQRFKNVISTIHKWYYLACA